MELDSFVDAINCAEDTFERNMLARCQARKNQPGPVTWREDGALEPLVENAIRAALAAQGKTVSRIDAQNAEHGLALQITFAYPG